MGLVFNSIWDLNSIWTSLGLLNCLETRDLYSWNSTLDIGSLGLVYCRLWLVMNYPSDTWGLGIGGGITLCYPALGKAQLGE